jgi:biotin carboxylase
MEQKRLLFLGGADIQIPAIQKAVEMGYYVITIDYLPGNPGHQYSHEYYNVSTTDKGKVLELAKKIKIHGISAYASDPAALTAAYVSEKLGLPGNTYQSIQTISDKISFRKIQQKVNAPCPRLIESSEYSFILNELDKFKHGGIIKPADTSGSKGIFKIDKSETQVEIQKKIESALSFSRSKRVVLEEYLVRKGFVMSGDFMVEKGKIIFYCFGDVHFNDAITGLVPRSISLPATLTDKSFFVKIIADLQKIVDELKITTGVFNCDVIQDEDSRPIILDIGARNGGNLFNDIISIHTGVDLIGLTIVQTLGGPVSVKEQIVPNGYYAHNVIHASQDGIFEELFIHPSMEEHIFYKTVNATKGQEVNRFINSGFRIGLVLLKFDDFGQMHQVLGNVYDYFRVVLKNNNQ